MLRQWEQVPVEVAMLRKVKAAQLKSQPVHQVIQKISGTAAAAGLHHRKVRLQEPNQIQVHHQPQRHLHRLQVRLNQLRQEEMMIQTVQPIREGDKNVY